MPGITYQVGLYAGRPLRPRRRRCPGCPGVTLGQNNDVALDVHQRDGRRDGPLRRADRRRHATSSRASRRPLEVDRGGDRGQGPRARAARRPRDPPRADRQRGARRRRRPSRSRSAGRALDFPASAPPNFGVLDSDQRPRAGRAAGALTPCRSRTWSGPTATARSATRRSGRLPIRQGGCPDLPKPGWTGEYEWEGWVPYEELPELDDPESRLPGHRQQPDRAARTSRTTSPATTSTATGRSGSRS